MKKHFCAWLGLAAALSFASLSSVSFAEETDQNNVSDPAQSMNVAPDANAEATTPDNNVRTPVAPNNNATPNQDDAHEDTANSGDDDY